MTKTKIILLNIISLIILISFVFGKKIENDDIRFVSYVVNPKKQHVALYWKNEKQENFRNIENLKLWLSKRNKELLFGMNGGMYKKDYAPQGLFIEGKIMKASLDTTSGNGNFYLKPNGIFYLTTDNTPFVCETANFIENANIKYATQSGPMLVIDGKIHSAFKENSTNLNIRNGVGILPNNSIMFAMSKEAINFYQFAEFFRKNGCKNALYLDGFVSRTYLPEKKWIQTDGNFGVLIGVSQEIK